jgi:hypothetical protein
MPTNPNTKAQHIAGSAIVKHRHKHKTNHTILSLDSQQNKGKHHMHTSDTRHSYYEHTNKPPPEQATAGIKSINYLKTVTRVPIPFI